MTITILRHYIFRKRTMVPIYDGVIHKYNTLNDYDKFDIGTFTGNIDIYDIDYNFQGVLQYENGVLKHEKVFHQDCYTFTAYPDGSVYWYFICGGGGTGGVHTGSGNWGGGPGDGIGGNGNYGGTGTGTGTGGTGGTPNPNDPTTIPHGVVVIAPNAPQLPAAPSMIMKVKLISQSLGLTQEQRNWLTANPEQTSTIYSYLFFEGNEEAARIAAKEILIQMMASGLNLHIQKSQMSPLNIDLSSIGTTPAEIKFSQIYNKLTQSPKFKQLFIDLFGVTHFVNAKFVVTDIPQAPGTYVKGDCQLLQPSLGQLNNLIRIDRQMLLDLPESELAVIIIHECIHAYLNIKMRLPSVPMPIEQINDMDFRECINLNYDGIVSSISNHSFIHVFLVPTMVDILDDIKNQLFTPAQIQMVEYPTSFGTTLFEPLEGSMPPINSDIWHPWNWNEYFTYLSYNGLEEAWSYPDIFPPNSIPLYWRNQYGAVGTHFYP